MKKPLRNAAAAVLSCSMYWAAAQAQPIDLDRQVDAVIASKPAASSRSFEEIAIMGLGNPLRRSDRRLSILIASLPLTTGSAPTKTSAWQQVEARLGFPADPNAAAGEAKRMMERTLAPPAGPDADVGIAAGAP
jgi:hypothetical protein